LALAGKNHPLPLPILIPLRNKPIAAYNQMI
jgi:hypothetical protein